MRRVVFEMSHMLSRFVVKRNRSAIFLTKQKKAGQFNVSAFVGLFFECID